jgi:Ca2+/H+ antiporter
MNGVAAWLFFMVLAVLIATFLDSTFLPSFKQLSRLCLICLPFCAYSQVMVTQMVTLKVAIQETSGCGLGARGYED